MASKKTVLITGCSDDGIGSALSLAFHAQGYHVFATARNQSKMSVLSKLPHTTLLTLDVDDSAQITRAVEAVKNETGGILDILINNAGVNHFSPVLDIDLAEAKRVFDINFWGALTVTQAFAPLVIKAKGSVVNITSIAGHINVPYMGLYSASKRSQEIVSETLRLELVPFGVKVLSVVTGAVRTNGQSYFEDWTLPEGSLYKPIEKLIASRAQGDDGVKRMDTMEFANKVANDIIGGASGKIWCGSNAGGVRFGSLFMPQSMMDSGAVKGTGLDQLPKSST